MVWRQWLRKVMAALRARVSRRRQRAKRRLHQTTAAVLQEAARVPRQKAMLRLRRKAWGACLRQVRGPLERKERHPLPQEPARPGRGWAAVSSQVVGMAVGVGAGPWCLRLALRVLRAQKRSERQPGFQVSAGFGKARLMPQAEKAALRKTGRQMGWQGQPQQPGPLPAWRRRSGRAALQEAGSPCGCHLGTPVFGKCPGRPGRFQTRERRAGRRTARD